MTRTERNQNPAALLKDRRSRSGLTNQSETQRKNGAGAHNWGSYREEGDLEAAASNDANDAMFDLEGENDDNVGALPAGKGNANANAGAGVAEPEADEQFANKDLAREAIATSPSESMSSLDSAGARGGRRMSNVSDEERERARVYREGVMGKGAVDLAHIAKTSYGIAVSPTNGGAGILATSPTQAKNGFAMRQ